MSALTDALQELRLRGSDSLVETLDREFKALSERRQFGLNFERHKPEFVELWGHSIRVGQSVRVLPSRKSGEPRDNSVWKVASIGSKVAKVKISDDTMERRVALCDLLPVAEFGERIFPGLEYTGEIGGGGEYSAIPCCHKW